MSNYSLKFIIRDDRKNEEGICPIYLRYTYRRKYKDIPLLESIYYKHFVKQNGTIDAKKCPNSQEIIEKMTTLLNKVKMVVNNYFTNNDEYPQTNNIVNLVKHYKPPVVLKKYDLDELFQDFLQNRESKFIKSSTFGVYRQFWSKWKSFEIERKGKISIDDLNHETFDSFNTFLIKSGRDGEGLQKNTIGKINKTLKTFLNYLSSREGIPLKNDYKKSVVVNKIKNDKIVLTHAELERLSSCVLYSNLEDLESNEISLTKRQRLIGRVFLLLCSTGLSYVDYNRLTINNIFIENDKYGKPMVHIKISRQKVSTTLDSEIPILNKTIDLLFVLLGYKYYKKDYDENKPFMERDDKIGMLNGSIKAIKREFKGIKELRIVDYIPVQKFNKEIKEVLKIIGIDERVKINTIKKNNKTEEFDYKYNLVSSHTGRRTYITWCITKGVDRSSVMKTSGITSLKTLQDYTHKDKESIYYEFSDKFNENIETLNRNYRKNKEGKRK